MQRILNRVVILVVAIALCFPAMLMAQSGRGTIDGVVTDSTGAVIPGADVVITEQGSGSEYQAVTTESGRYRVPYLPPGMYRVAASLTGFKTAVADNVTVRLAQVVSINLVLEVGEISEVVTVSSEGPLLETSSAEIGTNVSAKEIAAWPILVSDGTRQLQDFIFRALPGAIGGTWNGSINGGQGFSHEIMIEGITIGRMDINGGSNSEFTPTMDAVSEFKLQTGALSSQYGATQTALTNFGMKSGDNDYHGTAFLFYQNKALNANSWNNNRRGNEKSPFGQKNFGASGGGPIIKDKTHFYVSYEGDRYTDQTPGGNREDVPTGAMKDGNFSSLFDPAFTLDDRSGTVVGQDALGRDVIFGQIYDPRTSRQLGDGTWIRDPFPGNVIPSAAFSSVSQNMMRDEFDLPDAQDNLLRYNYDNVNTCCPERTINNFSVKIDHVLNDAHKLSGTFVSNDRYRNRFGEGNTPYLAGPMPGPFLQGTKLQDTPGIIFRMTEDWTLNPTILNHFALGYNRFQNANDAHSWLAYVAGEYDWKQELGLQNDQEGETFPPSVFAAHAEVLGDFYGQWSQSGRGASPTGSWVIADDMSLLKGNHNLRFGTELRWYYHNNQGAQENGSFTFHSENTSQPGFIDQTGFSVASWLMGEVYSAGMGIQRTNQGLRTKLFALYVQDDWKLRPNFTLNLGLRWDVPTPLYEKYGRMSSLVPTLQNTGADGYPGALAFLSGPDDRWIDTYKKQFAPRIGFAWSVSDSVVLRGGYGINYSPAIRDGWNTTYNAGFNGSNPIIARVGNRFREDAVYNWDTMYPAFVGDLPNTDPTQRNGQSIAYYRPDINKQPRVQNWNIGVQFDAGWDTRLEVNYVGNHGDFMNEARYINSQNKVPTSNLSLGDTLLDNIADHPEITTPYPSFGGTVGRALRPYPQFESVQSHRLNSGWSNYNALQLQATKRSAFGLSFLTSYTWSKTMGTGDTAGPSPGGWGQDYYDRKNDYSTGSFHYPHDLKVTWIYDLPFGPQGSYFTDGAGSYILGGWQLAAIMRYTSGAPYRISTSGYVTDALFNVGIRPDVLSEDQTVPRGEIDPINGTQYLNPSAFGTPPKTAKNVPVRFGTAPRYLPRTRAFATLSEDVSLIKRTDLGFREGANFEIRFDMVNFFNRTKWGGGTTNVTSANFGKVFAKGAIAPRRIQLGIRFTF